MDELLTVEDVARKLQVPRSWIYARTCPGARDRIPHVRCGKYLRFSWPEVEAWLLADRRPMEVMDSDRSGDSAGRDAQRRSA